VLMALCPRVKTGAAVLACHRVETLASQNL
jgi:hypothetical protein